MNHSGSLVVTKENAEYAKTLTSVGGDLYVEADGLQLPALETVHEHPLPDAETAKKNIAEVARHALQPRALSMNQWHTCTTVHCIAGWTTTILPGGKDLEREIGIEAAGAVLLGKEAAMHFHDSDTKARSWLEKFIISEAEAVAP